MISIYNDFVLLICTIVKYNNILELWLYLFPCHYLAINFSSNTKAPLFRSVSRSCLGFGFSIVVIGRWQFHLLKIVTESLPQYLNKKHKTILWRSDHFLAIDITWYRACAFLIISSFLSSYWWLIHFELFKAKWHLISPVHTAIGQNPWPCEQG